MAPSDIGNQILFQGTHLLKLVSIKNSSKKLKKMYCWITQYS